MSHTEKADRGLLELDSEECKGCGLCVEACPPKVLRLADTLNHTGLHPVAYLGSGCTGCGICFFVCPEPGAITVLRAAATTSEERKSAVA
ncbi:MAG: ferredoxin family protein [Acidobacteria bacterium]|nr:ferredoxin family protein [Acidobacteriota bacterium]